MASKLAIYQQAIRLFGDARLDVVTDDTESRYALDDAWDGAVTLCLRAAPWRFALKTSELGMEDGSVETTETGLNGFDIAFTKPTNWLRTHAIFVLQHPGAVERPIDVRETDNWFFANQRSIQVRYLDSSFTDPAQWSEHFAQALAAQLAFQVADRLTNSASASVRMAELYGTLMQEAVLHDAIPEDPWLRHQLDGTFQEALLYTLEQGFWRFALKTTAQSPGGMPYDWLRTHALFIPGPDGTERPFNIKEATHTWTADVTYFEARYVSTEFGTDPQRWTEPFLASVLAYLQLRDLPEAQTTRGQQPPSPVASFRTVLALALATEGEPENPWLRYQLDNSLQDGLLYILRQGFWRFALRALPDDQLEAQPGTHAIYANHRLKPADWLRTHALFIPGPDDVQLPFDVRERADIWATDATGWLAQYVSSDQGLDPQRWPEPFLVALLAYLHLRDAPEPAQQGRPETTAEGSIFLRTLGEALAVEAEPEDQWLRYQLDGTFQQALLYILRQGYWRFALKTIEFQAAPITDTTVGTPIIGYPYSYPQPADWLRTHALYLPLGDGRQHPFDIKEAREQWSTTANYFAVRYVSSDLGIDPFRWPEPFLVALLAYLTPLPAAIDQQGRHNTQAAEASPFMSALAAALAVEAEPEDPWLRYQLDGSFLVGLRYVLAQGYWRFALRTIHAPDLAAQPGVHAVYSNHRYKPTDWLRTHALYISSPDDVQLPFDIRERADVWTTDQTDWLAQYVSIETGFDPFRWPEPFLVALLAYLTPPPAAIDQQGRHNTQAAEASPFMSALAAALAVEAEPENPWLRYQLDGSFQEAVLFVLEQGYWRFALRAIHAPDLVEQPGTHTVYTNHRLKPPDWLRTHALYLLTPEDVQQPFDIRERADIWTTDQTDWLVQYVSKELGLAPLHWPEPFLAAVLAYLTPVPAIDQQGRHSAQAAEASPFAGALGAALMTEAEPEDEWLRFQLDGSFQEAVLFVLEQGYWRFALRALSDEQLEAQPGTHTIYANHRFKPSDWLRTHALYIPSPDDVQLPFDVRERADIWATDATGWLAQYVSKELGLDPLRWPQTFLGAVLGYLTMPSTAAEQKGGRGAPVEVSPFAATLGHALAVEAEPENEWLRYQLDGSFQEAVLYLLVQGYWRFAMRALPDDQLDAQPGTHAIYTNHRYKPADWLRTHALYIPSPEDVQLPFDIRERADVWTTDATGWLVQYISKETGLDPLRWPQPFLTTVLAYLSPTPAAPQERSRPDAAPAEDLPFIGALRAALEIEAEPEDEWLRYQLDGSFQESVLFVLKQGYWDFALKTIEFQAAPITDTSVGTPIIGYPNSYPQPDDMLRSHAFFIPAGDGREYPIDIKEDGNQWSTTANYFAVRYVSSALGLDPLAWQEPFLASVHAYLELRETPEVPQRVSRTTGQPIPAVAPFRNVLQSALAIDAVPENPWYRFQRNGAFLRACFHCAETGRWKFAINTISLEADAWVSEIDRVNGTLPANNYGDGSISPSYSAVFAKPPDWLRTVWIYRIEPHIHPSVNLEGWPERYEVDYRDELGNWHANSRQIQVRYIRRAAIESPRWPQSYADAVLAWLEYEEARQNPQATAIAAAKQRIYEDAVDKAAKSDDMQEFPPYRRVGHLVRGRFYRSRGVGAQDFATRY